MAASWTLLASSFMAAATAAQAWRAVAQRACEAKPAGSEKRIA